MDSRRGSSSRPPSPQPTCWERCSVPHSKLVTLQTKGFLPPAFMVPVQAGLATYNGGEQAESVPSPSKGERVCLVPYLIRGLRFPIHPFLRGLLGSMASCCTTLRLPPFCILQASYPFASCSWASRLISRCGRSCSALCPVLGRGRYIKWAEPNYGASPGPDIYPEPQERCPKTGLQNGFI